MIRNRRVVVLERSGPTNGMEAVISLNLWEEATSISGKELERTDSAA